MNTPNSRRGTLRVYILLFWACRATWPEVLFLSRNTMDLIQRISSHLLYSIISKFIFYSSLIVYILLLTFSLFSHLPFGSWDSYTSFSSVWKRKRKGKRKKEGGCWGWEKTIFFSFFFFFFLGKRKIDLGQLLASTKFSMSTELAP